MKGMLSMNSMYKISTLFSVAILCLSNLYATSDVRPPEFVFLVPSYNNEGWAKRNLDSLIHQKTTARYRIICVDDCSTDKTGSIMDEYAQDHKLSQTFLTIIHNKKRKGATCNIYTTIHEQCKDHEVVVLVDGDDIIAHNLVLDRLVHEYTDPNLWMTYGSFVFYPSSRWGTTL